MCQLKNAGFIQNLSTIYTAVQKTGSDEYQLNMLTGCFRYELKTVINTLMQTSAKKDLKDILFIIQARLGSHRVPQKMLRPFAGTNLFEISLKKVLESDIPNDQFRASVYEPELKAVVEKYSLSCYDRSEESANCESDLPVVYEWHDKFPEYKYAVLINACNLFLSVETINRFLKEYISSEHDGMFAVIPKKQYFWDDSGNMLTKWPDGAIMMNTKEVGTTYEAAHVLYAGRLDLIAEGMWMGEPPYRKNAPALVEISEFESLDIDYEWQFEVYTTYWEKLYGKSNS